MAEASATPKQANPVPHQGDHDRVGMLSVRADGTLDQHNPEIIGNVEHATEAAKVQFAQQAVSAVDVAERGAGTGEVEVADDPSVSALRDKQDQAAKRAESAAESAVKSLHPGA